MAIKNRKPSSQERNQRIWLRKTSSQEINQRKALLDLAATRLVKNQDPGGTCLFPLPKWCYKKAWFDGHRITGNSIAGLTFAGGELPV